MQGLQTSYESEQWRGAEQRGKELDNRKGKRQYLFQKCDTIARMAVCLLRHTEDIPCKPARTMERIQGYGQDGTPNTFSSE